MSPTTPSKDLSFTDYLQIKNVLGTYCIALDDQKFDLLNTVFDGDVICDYSLVRPDIGMLRGRDRVVERLKDVLIGKKTQHALTTQVFDPPLSDGLDSSGRDEDKDQQDDDVTVLTYFTATTYFEPSLAEEHFVEVGADDRAIKSMLDYTVVHGSYLDVVRKVERGGNNEWRIVKRTLKMHHPRVIINAQPTAAISAKPAT